MKISKATKILLGPSSFAELDKAPLEKLIEEGFELIENPVKRKLTKIEILELLPSVKGLIAGLEPLDREVLEKSDLKVISRCGSGLSNVDIQAAKELGIFVCNTPLGPTTAVAELTIGCLISLIRQVPQMNKDLHDKIWSKRIGKQLKGARVAVIGLGNIGQRVADLLLAFDAQVLAVDPFLSGRVEGIQLVELDEAIKCADIISLHANNDFCILSEREFELMKDGTYLLNAARGKLVDERALIKALETEKIAGAWIDTFGEEPYEGVLCNYEQVILTPHIGSYTMECRSSMEMEAVENLISAFKEINSSGT